jgi:hypothetical protein
MYICTISRISIDDYLCLQVLKRKVGSELDAQIIQRLLDDLAGNGFGIIDRFLNQEEMKVLNRYIDKILT